jgi:hypothetical protein
MRETRAGDNAMTSGHSTEEILSRLHRESIGTLGTMDPHSGEIRLRLMYYGIDDRFGCYLMSTKGSPKIDHLRLSAKFSFLVFGLEDPYDASWEVELIGTADLLETEPEIRAAVARLQDRNPFADVAVASAITAHFDYLKLIPETIRFRIYGEALQGLPATVLRIGGRGLPTEGRGLPTEGRGLPTEGP